MARFGVQSELMVAMPGIGLVPMIRDNQLQTLIYLFGVGWTASWFVFTLMYREALKARERLRLNELEIFITRISIFENLIGSFLGIVSILIALFGEMPENFALTSWIYLLMFPIPWVIRLGSW